MKKLKILVLGGLMAIVLCACVFADEKSEAEQAHQDVIHKGWITKEEFKEGTTLTRRQAIKTIMRITKLPDIGGHLPDFNDTVDDPDQAVFKKARNYGIITGNKAGDFGPDKAITKMQLVSWMDRVFDLPDTVNFENNKAKDNEKRIDPEAYYAINKYLELKILNADSDGRVKPRSTLTIDEFATIISRLSGSGIKDLKVVKQEGETQQETTIDPH